MRTATNEVRRRRRRRISFVVMVLILSSCTSNTEIGETTTSQSPEPTTPVRTRATVAETTVVQSAVVETTTSSPPDVVDRGPQVTELNVADQLNGEISPTSAEWFEVVVDTDGRRLDAYVLDVSDDGQLWVLMSQGTILVWNRSTKESIRLATSTEPASISGDGEYVIYAVGEGCADGEPLANSASNARRMVHLTSGETKCLGTIVEPVLINGPGDVVFGLAAPDIDTFQEADLTWADGTTTVVRDLFSEIGGFPESISDSPKLRDIDGSGGTVLYSTWLDNSGPPRPTYSILTPDGNIDLVGDEIAGVRVLHGADLSQDGSYFIFGTTDGIMSIDVRTGQQQHYLLTRFDRSVASYAIAGEHLVVLTVPPAGEEGPTQLVSFKLGTTMFDQSPQLLVNLDASVGLLPPGSGGIRLQSSSAGKAGLSVYFEDPTSSTGWSWVSFFVEVDIQPVGRYIEMTSANLTEEIEAASDERDPTSAFLAEVFDLQANLVSTMAISVRSGASSETLAGLWTEASDRANALEPPNDIAELNSRWVSNLDGFRAETELFAADLGSQDDETIQGAVRRHLLALLALTEESAAINAEQFALASEALSTRLDPEAVYVAAALSTQEQAGEARDVLQTFLGNLTTDAQRTMAEAPKTIDILMAQQLALSQIEVPTSGQPLHQARLDHLNSIVSILAKLLSDFEAGVSPSGILQLRIDRLVAQSGDLYAAWSRYISQVLR